MKIGIDARLWNQTGVGRYIRNLVYNLEKIDKKNEYVLFVRGEDLKDVKVQSSKFKVQKCDIRWHTIKEQLIFSRILNNENLDLVHFPYYSIPVFYRRPFIVTLHDLIPLHFQTGKASALPFPFYKFKFFAYRFVVFQAAKSAKKIIVPSEGTKEDIEEYLKIPSSKIEIINEGVDDKLINNNFLKKENFILYVGNAYPHKNLETLLSAIKYLDKRDLKLILVGKEDYFYKKIKKIVKKMNLDRVVEFYSEIEDKELSKLYKRAKFLVMPSLIEGFGLPVLEGMANGCLVLSSDIPVIREVAKDAAVYFNPKSPEEISKVLNDVYVNYETYRTKIKMGFERVKEFSWRKTAEQTLKVYEQSA